MNLLCLHLAYEVFMLIIINNGVRLLKMSGRGGETNPTSHSHWENHGLRLMEKMFVCKHDLCRGRISSSTEIFTLKRNLRFVDFNLTSLLYPRRILTVVFATLMRRIFNKMLVLAMRNEGNKQQRVANDYAILFF